MLLNISGGSTVVVGVKFDSLSNELLAWALVKAAEPGDCVIALHVVGNEENADQGGKASPLSLIKAFDSVLYACEGFCNLKQVDLKLKICRGLSVKKIIVREAISHSAAKVIVGTATKHHKIRSSTSVAKYCARKLPKTCSVLAVNNGKVSYQREGSEGSEDHRSSSLLNSIHRKMSFTKNCKVLCVGNALAASKSDIDHSNEKDSLQDSVKEGSYYREDVMEQNCSICGSVITAVDMEKSANVSSGDGGDDALAMVPVPKEEAASSSISTLIRQLPEVRPGWPLLRRAMTDRKVSDRSSTRQTSVIQWVMRLPSRRNLCISDSDHRKECSIHCENKYSRDDEESGAIVPVGTPSPDRCSQILPEELVGVHDKYSATCRLFKYHELLSATSNFFAENLVGRGGSSEVYWGSLPDGKELAVKILKPSNNVLKEFILEIEIITTLHHKNIISLMGFCYEDTNLLLVYDFLSRGSLEENLYGIKKDPNAFGWNERYKVAVGVAEALDYLHSRNDKPVIHRDVKSSNILLSNDFEPQLSDFGLAKWASTSSTYITCTDVAGTFGYLAPEYFMYGKVNDKIDVYAYGVVLLELLSGRKPIENDYPKGQESLVMWAKPILNGGKVSQLLDPSLGNDYDLELIERMVLAATLCIRRAPRARPHMSLVLKLLQGDSDATKWARMQANASDGSDTLHNKAYPRTNLQSHLNIALRDLEDDSLSMSSVEQCVSLEDYLKGRWSRSSSFD